jgi:hypothetical protein
MAARMTAGGTALQANTPSALFSTSIQPLPWAYFVLVHSGKRATSPSQRKRWLLIKHRDEFIDPAWDIAKPELDRSAVSGRTLAEIASGRPAKKRKTSVA